jgi:putative DNA primase/helicase
MRRRRKPTRPTTIEGRPERRRPVIDLRAIARALGGEVAGGQVLCPGPGHGPRDRSLSIKLSATAPDGFVAYSHAGDDFRACRDYVAERLGLRREGRARVITLKPPRPAYRDGNDERVIAALNIWNGSTGPIGTPAQVYLASRGVDLGEDLAGDVVRWSPRIRAMVALFRSIENGEPRAVSCTYLNPQAQKIERKFHGPVGGAASMLDPFDEVLEGLHVAEGVESAMSARQLGLRPTWALGSAGAIGRFPVLAGIESLTLLAENDQASAAAVEACAARWHAAGREVLVCRPTGGNDLNDAVRRRL